jgi:GT2 family glycosyltransferase
MNSVPKLSVIIVNWNRADDVTRAVQHLGGLNGLCSDIIVVDNGSTDDSVERLRALGSIRLVTASANLGPAGARNLGIEAARNKYLFFLDSDAVLGKLSIARMVARMDADPKVGIIGCRIINGHTRRLDQWIYPESAATHERQEFQTYSFSAAGALVRAEALRKSGGFWDDLFIYNEEVDLSIRVIRAGYRILYWPDSKVFHYPATQGRLPSGIYWYYQIRNWIWIFYRYYPSWARRRMVVLYVLTYLAKATLAGRLWPTLRGIVDGLKRTEIIGQYDDKLSERELRRLHSLNVRRLLWLNVPKPSSRGSFRVAR